ncbi:MAG: carboxypeptidase M32 [Candidatus Hydrogenedentes bacterium]|nr:carboxypeptidase M32 [Candidatus Hydrogenedentota bacterium]
MAPTPMDTLKTKMAEVLDVRAAINLLQWDLEVMMPPKGAEARGMQLATLSALAHRLFVTQEMEDCIKAAEDAARTPDEKTLAALTRYDYTRATCLPEAFVQKFAGEQSKAYQVWVKAREESDFRLFQPHLQTLLGLLREKAEYHGYAESPYDALIEDYEPGMTSRQLDAIFGDLAPRQTALLQRIMASPHQPDLAWLDQQWDADAQWTISEEVLRDLGFDFQAGRQDKSVHPFSTNFDIDDARITTRLNPNELFSALTGSTHECGHAFYEMGFLKSDRRTLLAQAISLGIHESQSRLWENAIGRSLPFWEHYTPLLKKHFGAQLQGVDAHAIHRAVNHVAPTFIRVEADECTYNLHVVLRYEIERALVEGSLDAAGVPTAWNEKMKQYLGLEVPDDAQGCLQDIHWSHGSMGYFPTYALGNLYAVQMLEVIERDIPQLWEDVGRANFHPLLNWLRTHVHRVGRRMKAQELIESISGKAASAEPYMTYLERKYAPLYHC